MDYELLYPISYCWFLVLCRVVFVVVGGSGGFSAKLLRCNPLPFTTSCSSPVTHPAEYLA